MIDRSPLQGAPTSNAHSVRWISAPVTVAGIPSALTSVAASPAEGACRAAPITGENGIGAMKTRKETGKSSDFMTSVP